MFKYRLFQASGKNFVAENSELFSKQKFLGRLKDAGNWTSE